MHTIPFTYKLFFKPTQQWYYGVRWAKHCSPTDLWTTYFTSSKHVKRLIDQYGADSFVPTVSKLFTAKSDAIAHESRVLRKVGAASNGKFINKSNGSAKFAFSAAGLVTIYNLVTSTGSWHDPTLPIPAGWVLGFSPMHKHNISQQRVGIPNTRKGHRGKPIGPCTDRRKQAISVARLQTEKLICPHCGTTCDPGNFKQFHGDNCSAVNQMVAQQLSASRRASYDVQVANGTYHKPIPLHGTYACPHCSKVGTNWGNMQRNHFNRCKLRPTPDDTHLAT